MKARIKEAAVGPFFALVTIWFAMEYLRPQDYVSAIGTVRPALLLLIAMFLAWLVRGDKGVLRDSLVRWFGVFIALGLMSVFFARNTYWAAQSNLFLISFLIGGVLPFTSFMDRPEALRRFFGWWVLFHALIALAGLARGGTGSGSFMQDENDLALTLAMALPFAYFLATQGKRTWPVKLLFLGAGLLMIAAIVASRSRGGFLGLMMASFAIVWFSRNRARNLIAVALIGLAVALAVSQDYVAEMSSIQDARDATRRSRLYYWGRAWEMFMDNPVLGIGSSNYGWRVEDYEQRDPTFYGNRALSGGRVSHSLYFTVLPEYGTVGTAVFGILVLGVWHRLRRVRKRLAHVASDEAEVVTALARASNASLLAFLVSGAFLSVLYYPHFWYLIGFTVALDRVSTKLAPALAQQQFPRRVRQRASPSRA